MKNKYYMQDKNSIRNLIIGKTVDVVRDVPLDINDADAMKVIESFFNLDVDDAKREMYQILGDLYREGYIDFGYGYIWNGNHSTNSFDGKIIRSYKSDILFEKNKKNYELRKKFRRINKFNLQRWIYKDLKKKLLALALSIPGCVVVLKGIIEIYQIIKSVFLHK